LHEKFADALAEAKRKNTCLVGWASRLSGEHEAACKSSGIPLVRLEDGFLRSVGLGAGLAPAASMVLDSKGIYYDASRASDLEEMLEHLELNEQQRQRGAQLRKLILNAQVSKYNTGKKVGKRGGGYVSFPDDRLKILVPGQVSDDAAILKTRSNSIDLEGANNINLELLKAVRKNNPDAFIIYKPHPDVASDLRKGRIKSSELHDYADWIISNVDIIELIEKCDRVETLTSLTGFEALIRGKDVTTHGLPFYAGWGVTTDHTTTMRRSRNRSIDELVYIALVAYSRYVDPRSFQPCEAEELIGALQELRKSRRLKFINALRLQIAWIGDKLNPATTTRN